MVADWKMVPSGAGIAETTTGGTTSSFKIDLPAVPIAARMAREAIAHAIRSRDRERAAEASIVAPEVEAPPSAITSSWSRMS